MLLLSILYPEKLFLYGGGNWHRAPLHEDRLMQMRQEVASYYSLQDMIKPSYQPC